MLIEKQHKTIQITVVTLKLRIGSIAERVSLTVFVLAIHSTASKTQQINQTFHFNILCM